MITKLKQILESKMVKTGGKEMEKKHFGNVETIYSVILYKINSFHTTPTIFSKTVPSHTKKNIIVNRSSYIQKELPYKVSAMGASLPHAVTEVLHVASSRQRPEPWLPISCQASAWFCLAAALLRTIHSFIIACKEKKKIYPTEFPPNKHFPEARGFAIFLERGRSALATHTGASQQKHSSESKERE